MGLVKDEELEALGVVLVEAANEGLDRADRDVRRATGVVLTLLELDRLWPPLTPISDGGRPCARTLSGMKRCICATVCRASSMLATTTRCCDARGVRFGRRSMTAESISVLPEPVGDEMPMR
jgi:hypothetical protein